MNRLDPLGSRAHRLVRSVVTAGGSQAGILLVSLLVTPVLVSGLGLQRYGLWALAGVLVNYIGLVDLGFGGSFVRFLALHHARGDARRFNTVVRLGLLFYGSFALVILPTVAAARRPLLDALSVAEELRGEAAFLLLGVTGIFLIRSVFVVFRAALAAVERIDVNNRLALVVAIPGGLGAILVVHLGFGLRGLTLNGLGVALLTIALQTIAAYRLVPRLRLLPFRLEWSLLPELFCYGARIQVTRFAELVNGQVDKLILGLLVGAAAAGVYDLGMKVSLLAAAIPTLLLPVVLPTSSLLAAHGDHAQLEALHRRATKYVGLVLAPAAIFLLVACPALLRLWLGPGELDAAAMVARLLLLGSVPLLGLGVSRLVARGLGYPQMEMWASLLMAAANVALSIVLVRWLGAMGAPLGSCCAGLLGGTIFLLAYRRRIASLHNLDPIRPLVAPVLLAGIAGMAAFASMELARLLQLPEGRTGALVELAFGAVPFGIIWVTVVVRSGLLDEYDQRVARETWATARAALGRAGATR